MVLGHQELHPPRVHLAQHGPEVLQAVVLAAQGHHQHGPGVGVVDQAPQQALGGEHVVAQLAAPGVVAQGPHAVQPARVALLGLVGQQPRRLVHAAHGGHDPQLVAGARRAVRPQVALEGSLPAGGGEALEHRPVGVILVLDHALQVGDDVVDVHQLPGAYVPGRVADGQAVLDDLSPLGDVLQRHLEGGGDVLQQHQLPAPYGAGRALLQGRQGNGDVVVGLYQQQLRSIHGAPSFIFLYFG